MYINSSLIAQFIVFILLVFFTMKFIWPSIIKALDERSSKIAEGLAAAEKGKLEFQEAEKEVAKMLAKGREAVSNMLSDAQKKAQQISEDVKMQSNQEAKKILEQAKSESLRELESLKKSLTDDFSDLIVQGVEKILHREIDVNKHKDIIDGIKKDFTNDRV